jgi:uncharacterized protein (UPF0332 family)
MKGDTRKLLDKAGRAIQAARTLLDADQAEFAAGRLYLAMFYVAEALLYEEELSFGKHSAVHAAYGKEFAKTGRLDPKFHRWLLEAFNIRLETDYGFNAIPTDQDARDLLDQAQEFLDTASSFLAQGKEQQVEE